MPNWLTIQKHRLASAALIGSALYGAFAGVPTQAFAENDGNKAFDALFDCLASATRKLDDGSSDVKLVGDAVRPLCQDKYTAAVSGYLPNLTEAERRVEDKAESEFVANFILDERASRAK